MGGIKEKALAAHRAGVKCVVFPAKNKADLGKIPDDIRKDLEIVAAEDLPQVLEKALK